MNLQNKQILRHNDERGMSNEEIKNTSGLLIIAGSETTATLLSGVTFFLLTNPDAYNKAKSEVRQAFQSADEMTLVTTSKLPYLHACLEEALRMYPPVPLALPRRTGKEGAVIDGVFVPGGVRSSSLIRMLRMSSGLRMLGTGKSANTCAKSDISSSSTIRNLPL